MKVEGFRWTGPAGRAQGICMKNIVVWLVLAGALAAPASAIEMMPIDATVITDDSEHSDDDQSFETAIGGDGGDGGAGGDGGVACSYNTVNVNGGDGCNGGDGGDGGNGGKGGDGKGGGGP